MSNPNPNPMIIDAPNPIDVIQALLTNDPKLLTIRELGRLFICSKAAAAAFGDAAVWKTIFEECAALGHETYETSFVMWMIMHRDDRKLETWAGGAGLLGWFSKPDEKVLAKVGYKCTAGCLRGKTCFKCGRMEAHANPLLMVRLCKPCSMERPTRMEPARSGCIIPQNAKFVAFQGRSETLRNTSGWSTMNCPLRSQLWNLHLKVSSRPFCAWRYRRVVAGLRVSHLCVHWGVENGSHCRNFSCIS